METTRRHTDGPILDAAWVRDTGLIFALGALVLSYTLDQRFLAIAFFLVAAVAFVPALVRPLAIIWFHIARILGMVMNHVFFGVVFFLIVTPIGVVRRVLGHDEMRRPFRTTSALPTAFTMRTGGPATRADITRPF